MIFECQFHQFFGYNIFQEGGTILIIVTNWVFQLHFLSRFIQPTASIAKISRDLEIWPVTLTFQFDIVTVNINVTVVVIL